MIAPSSCLAIALLTGGASLAPSGASGLPQGDVVARVNGQPVSRVELERTRTNPLTLRQAREELGTEDPTREALDRIAMRKVIHRSLLVQEARRRKVTVTDRELDDAIVALRRQFDDLRSFGAWMKDQGLDERALFETVREDMAAGRVWTALAEGARVTDEQVRGYYEAHAQELRREEVRLRVIAVRDEATANDIVGALRRGEDFARLARERSRGRLAANGGDTGWIESGTLRPPLREAVATLGEREFRGPLPKGPDYLLVLLQGRRPGGRATLAEARSEIESRLLRKGRQEMVEAWLGEQERNSRIEVFPAGPARHAPRDG